MKRYNCYRAQMGIQFPLVFTHVSRLRLSSFPPLYTLSKNLSFFSFQALIFIIKNRSLSTQINLFTQSKG
ncbi:hypothetical protein ACHQM5_029523 [Ranunculus cassubicifolius]